MTIKEKEKGEKPIPCSWVDKLLSQKRYSYACGVPDSTEALAETLAGIDAETSVIINPTLGKLDDTPRIGIISAIKAEFETLFAETTYKTSYIVNGRTMTTGKLRGKDVVVYRSGDRMVNGAMGTQQLLDYFNITKIVFSGIGGGINPNLNLGDIYVAARWREAWDGRIVNQQSDGTYEYNWKEGSNINDTDRTDLEETANFGTFFPTYITLCTKSGTPDVEEAIQWYPVDSEMLEIAEQVGKNFTFKVSAPDVDGNMVSLDKEPQVVVGGNSVSGSFFVDNAEYREYLWKNFKAHGVEMESAAVAHVCYSNEVPFIVFRGVSDLAGGQHDENQLSIFFKVASENSAALVLKFMEALPQ